MTSITLREGSSVRLSLASCLRKLHIALLNPSYLAYLMIKTHTMVYSRLLTISEQSQSYSGTIIKMLGIMLLLFQ
jgi:hypothetical protein